MSVDFLAHYSDPAAHVLENLSPLRAELLTLIRQRRSWTKHRDFHHLNSSQAMCWNVLMPALVLAGGLQQVGTAMGTPSPIKAIDFEAIPD